MQFQKIFSSAPLRENSLCDKDVEGVRIVRRAGQVLSHAEEALVLSNPSFSLYVCVRAQARMRTLPSVQVGQKSEARDKKGGKRGVCVGGGKGGHRDSCRADFTVRNPGNGGRGEPEYGLEK